MYEKNKAVVLTEFVDFIDLSAQKLALTDMRFAVVIPHFYDSAVAWTPKVTSAGITDHTYNHLLRILDKKEGNAIIIMAYRDYFSGKNGIEDISKSEVVLAGKTKVIIAQETGNYEPNYITHYGQSRANLDAVIGQINANFGVYEGFGGVAVHHLETFLALP